jgi:hypothetical protein
MDEDGVAVSLTRALGLKLAALHPDGAGMIPVGMLAAFRAPGSAAYSSRTGTAMSARSNPHGLNMQLSSHHPWLPGASPSRVQVGRTRAARRAGPPHLSA